MSRIDELIQHHCPNGVEYNKLSEVIDVSRGVRVIKKQLGTDGIYPVYQNSMTPLGYYEKYNCPANTAFVIAGGAAGDIGFSSVDFWAADDCYYFTCPENYLSRFLYYVLLSQHKYIISSVHRASIPRLARSVLMDMKIPVPPLPVQKEIVRTLDKFTQLEAELEAELEARKKQYESYRDKLLNFNKLDSSNRGGGIS